jgi:hypothetical protein
MLKKISLAFSGGVFGGLVNSVAAWLFGQLHLNAALGVALSPTFTPGWLYPRLVWGGLWGLLFATPLFRSRGLSRGLWLSLGPTLAAFFWFLPHAAGKGYFGLKMGSLTPVVVLVLNGVWGLAAAAWLRKTGVK